MRQGWEVKRLGEVCEQITDGSHFSPKSSSDDKYPYITVRDIENDQIDFTNCKFIGENEYQSLLKNGCKPNFGDILFSKDGTVGKVSLVNFERDFVVLSSLAIIRPKKDNIFSPLLKYILKDPAFLEKAIGMKTGVAIKRIILKNLKLIEISYPKSLPEQQRIVAILDEAFTAIAKAKANAEQNLKNAKELFESYLQSVFENPDNNWGKRKFGDVCGFVRGPFGGSLKKNSFKLDGYAVYEQQHAIYNQFDNVRYFIDDDKFNEMKRFELNSGDLIMSCSGTMGKIAIVPENIKKGIINQALLKLSPSKMVSNNFLKLWMQSESFQDSLKEYSGGAAIQNVASVAILKNIEIPLPLIEEQKNIVKDIQEFSNKTKKLEAIYQQKINDLEELKKSILQKAFSGELKTDKDMTT